MSREQSAGRFSYIYFKSKSSWYLLSLHWQNQLTSSQECSIIHSINLAIFSNQQGANKAFFCQWLSSTTKWKALKRDSKAAIRKVYIKNVSAYNKLVFCNLMSSLLCLLQHGEWSSNILYACWGMVRIRIQPICWGRWILFSYTLHTFSEINKSLTCFS